MKIFLTSVLLLLLSLRPGPAQVSMMIAATQAITGNYGNPTSAGSTLQSSVNNTTLYVPFTTGANSAGYTLTHLYAYSGAAAGKVYTALYTNVASGCSSGTNCPNSLVCHEDSGVVVSGTAFTEDTPTGCGTLAANTTYWIAQNSDNASREVAYQASSNCPAPLAFSQASSYDSGSVAGTWANPGTGATATTNCYVEYVVLTTL